MKAAEILVGASYLAKVSGKVVPVTVTRILEPGEGYRPTRRWWARNEITGRNIEIKSCQRFRAPVAQRDSCGQVSGAGTAHPPSRLGANPSSQPSA